MKKVLRKEELYSSMQEAIHLLCDTVKETLGPKGKNVIIDHSLFTPFITNDGATIARNIESSDEVINTILEIAKEASLKTDVMVGDGTTTTLVLLESIFDLSLELIKKGMQPMLLKKKLEKSLEYVLKLLEQEKRMPSKKEYESIAKIAANDKEMGFFINEVYQKIKTKEGIQIQEVNFPTLEVTYQKGYSFPIELASPLFLKGQDSCRYEQPTLLFLEDNVEEIDDYSTFINDAIQNKKCLLFLANEFSETFLQNCVYLNQENTLSSLLFKINAYGMMHKRIQKDLEFLTHKNKENFGVLESITFTSDSATISFTPSKETEDYAKQLKEESIEIKDEFDQEFYHQRIAMFLNGLATVKIGASTKTECHEKKMRLVDALWALDSASEGTLLGGGLSLLKIAKKMKIEEESDAIFKEALEMPFKQILSNAGLDNEEVLKRLEQENMQVLYNVATEEYESILNTEVIDVYKVVKQALENACSIATMLLTTTSLIINEHQENLNKTSEYTEL